MRRQLIVSTAACTTLAWVLLAGQAPQLPQGAASPSPSASGSVSRPLEPTGRIAGRVISGDTGRPLSRVSMTLIALPSKAARGTVTDSEGRYEFTRLPGGRYQLRPDKPGYVIVRDDPFAAGIQLDIADGEDRDRTDFSLPAGGVITGRITDEFGEPIAGVTVQAARFQYRPSGERQLITGSTNNFFMPSGTNDLGEYRIYGLRPGAYYLSARQDTEQIVALAQAGDRGVANVGVGDGLTTTYYPGTAILAEAQAVEVSLAQEATASFTLVPVRMARVTGTVRDSHGEPLSGVSVRLRQLSGIQGGWFGTGGTQMAASGRFALANVAPGDYVIDITPAPSRGAAGGQRARNEFASVPVSVSGDDIDLSIVTRPGIAVSGRVVFEGASDVVRQNLRIAAPSEQDARNFVQYFAGDGSAVDEEGRFHLPSVFGLVMFRTSPLPANVMLKAVTLNGVDLTNTPFDATGAEDVTNLEITLVDKQSRIVGLARNARGELQTNFRLIIYPSNLRPGDVHVRFQHNASPNEKGEAHIGRMPPGDYVGLAIRGVHPGEEWNPETRKRIEQLGRRFSLKEDETLHIDFPYLE